MLAKIEGLVIKVLERRSAESSRHVGPNGEVVP